MKLSTCTEPYTQTRPRSLRPRSTSITCSARSFSSASSSSAIALSSSTVAPRGRVPAIGRVQMRRPGAAGGGPGERLVLVDRGAARAGSGDRAGPDAAAGDGEQRLRRRADELEVLEVQEVH